MSTHPSLAKGKATALPGADCQCADCRLFFPGGELFIYPHGNICEDCDQTRVDRGMDREAFGESPRAPQKVTTAIVRPNAALLGTAEERDAFADEMLRRERAAEAEELHTEGHVPRRPFRSNPHD